MQLPNPMMIVMRSCPLPYGAAPKVHEPATYSMKLTRVAHTEIVAVRTLPNLIELFNGVAIVTMTPDSMGMFNVKRTIAAAKNVTLVPSEGAAVNLWTGTGASDGRTLPTTTGIYTIKWEKSSPTDAADADMWDVALIDVSSNPAVVQRIYTVVNTHFLLRSKDLTSGKEYVLRFTAYNGRPAARTGDFRSASGDQSISIVHSRTFIAP
jgi:hypothetical protein